MNTNEWIQHIEEEIEAALRFFYSQKAYYECLRDPGGIEVANKNALFWRLFSASTQRSLFISLGRLFDGVEGARSFPKFQGHCMLNVKDFSKTSLELRRISENGGVRPKYLDSYLSECFEPSKEDLARLFSPVSYINSRARDIYQRIRSKVFAHAIWTKDKEYEELFSSANDYEIEQILLILWAVQRNIWQLYQNGRMPEQEYLIFNYQHKSELYESIWKAFFNN